jgi:NAD(P)-dependent dehydrogenase (short-subunit alcohol dehydrogenase family)
MKLAGQVAVVTGGGSGIGAASCRLLAREGARICVVDADEAAAASVAGEFGDAARAVGADVADWSRAEACVAEILRDWGRLDVLATCAGISTGGTALTITPEQWDRVFAVNARGTFLWAKAALPQMLRQKRGAIVMVASQLAFNNAGNNAAYIASKGAIVSLARTMAVDHGADGVRVNALVPGVIDTPMPRRSLQRYADPGGTRQRWEARHPMKRFGTPEEAAKAVLFLACDDSSFTTGSMLFVDGGYTAH